MSLKKQYLKRKPICKVTFVFDKLPAENVAVIGDFNNWDTSVNQLKKLKNGSFKATINLESNHSYQFRYFVDGSYLNEDEADGLLWNDFAADNNCLLNV